MCNHHVTKIIPQLLSVPLPGFACSPGTHGCLLSRVMSFFKLWFTNALQVSIWSFQLWLDIVFCVVQNCCRICWGHAFEKLAIDQVSSDPLQQKLKPVVFFLKMFLVILLQFSVLPLPHSSFQKQIFHIWTKVLYDHINSAGNSKQKEWREIM